MFTNEIDSRICSIFNRAAVGDHLDMSRDAFEVLCQVTTPDVTKKHTQHYCTIFQFPVITMRRPTYRGSHCSILKDIQKTSVFDFVQKDDSGSYTNTVCFDIHQM